MNWNWYAERTCLPAADNGKAANVNKQTNHANTENHPEQYQTLSNCCIVHSSSIWRTNSQKQKEIFSASILAILWYDAKAPK